MKDKKIIVVVPVGVLRSYIVAERIDCMIRTLAVISKKTDRELESKYGTIVDNDTFMMHPFCWCEQDGCPWCGRCDCEVEHYLDGSKVGLGEYFDDKNKNKKREARLIKACGDCTGTKQRTPNFHHKKSGFKVWWYKYISRSMEYQIGTGPIERVDPSNIMSLSGILSIELDCLRSIGVIE